MPKNTFYHAYLLGNFTLPALANEANVSYEYARSFASRHAEVVGFIRIYTRPMMEQASVFRLRRTVVMRLRGRYSLPELRRRPVR